MIAQQLNYIISFNLCQEEQNSKQKFISQIMTSKSPVRSSESILYELIVHALLKLQYRTAINITVLYMINIGCKRSCVHTKCTLYFLFSMWFLRCSRGPPLALGELNGTLGNPKVPLSYTYTLDVPLCKCYNGYV